MRIYRLFAGVVVLIFILSSIYFLSGFYNISATSRHWGVTETLLKIVRDNSIERQAKDIVVPDYIEKNEVIVKGAGNYETMCSSCHLAPGIKSSELSAGLYPKPPNLTLGKPDDPSRLFWVIKNGIKLTAMPAWGESHNDEDIWAMVAFINKLPDLDEKAYRKMVKKSGGHHHSNNKQNNHHDHDKHAH